MTRAHSRWIPAFAGMTISLAAAASAVPPHQSLPGVSPEPILEGAGVKGRADLEAFVDGIMAAHLKYKPLAGATLAVVKDGEVLLLKGYGYADLATHTPVDAERSLFRPGSTSKLFTWTAVMQLVEQGKLDLDADVNTYIPDFKIPEAFGKPITLRNLMTHTPGLEDGGLGYLLARDAAGLRPLGEALKAHMPARVRPPTTNFGGDGTNSSYSNWGCALAGHIVASVSGMSFDDYLEKNIFAPLGMTSSTFAEPLPPALAPRMATGHRFKDGRLEPNSFEFVHSFGPAGSMTSSAADMAKFMISALDHGKGVLKPETADLMQGRQFGVSPYLNGSGLGFYETWINGRRLIGHGGDLVAFHSDLVLLPEEKLGIFVSYNSSNEEAPHIARRDLVKSFMDRYYPARLPAIKAPAGFHERAARYAGSYAANRGSYTKFERVFGLFGATKVQPTKDDKLLITDLLLPGASYWVEVAPNVFREDDGEAMIAFVEDEQGRITHLVNDFPFIGAHKLPWWGTPEFHQILLALGLLGFLVAIVSALRNWTADRAAPAGARRARRLLALLGLAHLAFLALMVASFAIGVDDLLYALPTTLYVALALPLLAVPLTVAVAALAASGWRHGWFTAYQRAQYSAIVLLGVAVLWSLWYWNLVGYRIG